LIDRDGDQRRQDQSEVGEEANAITCDPEGEPTEANDFEASPRRRVAGGGGGNETSGGGWTSMEGEEVPSAEGPSGGGGSSEGDDYSGKGLIPPTERERSDEEFTRFAIAFFGCLLAVFVYFVLFYRGPPDDYKSRQ